MWSKPFLCRFRQSRKVPQTQVSRGFASFRLTLSRIQPRHSQSRRATNCAIVGLSGRPHSIPYSTPVFKSFLHRRPQKETPPGAAGKRQAAGGDMREGEWLAESDSAPRTGKAAQLLRQLSHPALAVGNVPVDGNPLPAGPFLMGGHLGQQLCRRRSQPDGAGTDRKSVV